MVAGMGLVCNCPLVLALETQGEGGCSRSLPYPFLEFPGLSLKPMKQEKWRPLALGGPSLRLTTTHLPSCSDPTLQDD